MPACFHNHVDGIALPISVDNVAARKIVEVFAVMRVRPEADRGFSESALSSVNVLYREHIAFIMWLRQR